MNKGLVITYNYKYEKIIILSVDRYELLEIPFVTVLDFLKIKTNLPKKNRNKNLPKTKSFGN